MSLNSRRLQPLQQLAEDREEKAARRLLDCQRLVAEREQRLHELTGYVAEYERTEMAGSVQLLRNRHAFLERLRAALEFQLQLVEQARRDCETERGRWLSQRRDLSVLDQMAAMYRRREAHAEEQRAQKRMDDFAIHRHLRLLESR